MSSESLNLQISLSEQVNENNNDYVMKTSLKFKFNYHSELTVPLSDFDWDIVLQLCLLSRLDWKSLDSF